MYPWWDFGGIVRDVSLIGRPPVHLVRQKVEATPDLSAGTAAVKAAVWVANTTSEEVEREVTLAVSRDGGPAATAGAGLRQSLRIPPFGEAAARFAFELRKGEVALWHPDTPVLYRVRAGIAEDSLEDRFGIRRVEVRNAQLLLNGEPIRMGGANREADDPQFGLIEPASVIERDLRLMKEAGLELARHIHYAPAPASLDWADRHGLLLILENGNWQFTPGQMDSPLMRGKWQAQMREMIERDWNHPSVIGWSVGNEFESNSPAGIRWVRDARDFVRSLDSSRLVSFASNHAADASNRRPGDEATHLVDLLMLNTYATGVQAGAVLDRAHRLWPDKPILISEFGIRADGYDVMGVPAEGDPVAAQREYFRQFFAVVRQRPWICGASVWTFNDYRSRFPGTNPDGYRWWGLVDPRRNRRPAYEQVRTEFSPAVLGELRLGGSASVELRTRADFPAYTLRGYRLRWVWLDRQNAAITSSEEPLPDLPPGSARTVNATPPAGAAALRLEVIRPTGFRMIDRRYELANRPGPARGSLNE
jgi:beta-glucuronidase